MPGATSVVQLAGVPRMPSTSTTQSRHEPNCLTMSVAQSLGTEIPASAAARITVEPRGTVTARPSMVSVTGSPVAAGVPKSSCGV